MTKQFDVVVLWLYDPETGKLLTGGMERWCRDVARLARSHGFRVCIWQKSPKLFEEQIEPDIVIRGVRAPMSFRGHRVLAKALERERAAGSPTLFVSQEILGFGRFPRSAAVNHGIWWDGDFPCWKRMLNKRLQRKLIMNAAATICVDTNYINWCHAELPRRKEWAERLFYVPNYADGGHFKPSNEARVVDPQSPTILFPRRVNGKTLNSDGRGAGLLTRAVEILESEGMRPRLIFAGRGRLQGNLEAWAEQRGMRDRLEVTEVSLDEMPRLYARADVVVVPSLEHEGTSLSAVEGLVSGKPVVVSHIGGLGNIVIDRLNGYVCDLTPESLAAAIREAVNHHALSATPGMLEACRESLGKERWDKRVWSILKSNLDL